MGLSEAVTATAGAIVKIIPETGGIGQFPRKIMGILPVLLILF